MKYASQKPVYITTRSPRGCEVDCNVFHRKNCLIWNVRRSEVRLRRPLQLHLPLREIQESLLEFNVVLPRLRKPDTQLVSQHTEQKTFLLKEG